MSGAARATDPETSHEAARSLHDLPTRRRAVLAVIRRWGPMTDALLVETYDAELDAGTLLPPQSHSGIRTRRSELVRSGDVIDSGFRWKLPSGRHAIVWRSKQ
jgi:hypothetical protein